MPSAPQLASLPTVLCRRPRLARGRQFQHSEPGKQHLTSTLRPSLIALNRGGELRNKIWLSECHAELSQLARPAVEQLGAARAPLVYRAPYASAGQRPFLRGSLSSGFLELLEGQRDLRLLDSLSLHKRQCNLSRDKASSQPLSEAPNFFIQLFRR